MSRLPLLCLALSLSATPSLRAQSSDASISGTITDPSGAVVISASVTARNVNTGVQLTTKSNQSGVYAFPSLPPGTYTLRAASPGFQTSVLESIPVEVGARLSLNFQLPLGDTSQQVEVVASSESLIAYENSSIGGVITGQRVLDLPLPSRNALGLTLTQAGIVGDNLAGSRIGALNITLDGVNIQDQRLNQGVSSPILTTTDKVEEFRVVTSPVDAELGRGSGQIQMISRSGSNDYHGSLFYFHRNTLLNANNWFNNQRGSDPRTGEPLSPRNVLIRNQFGARVGGPVKKNQTFFHFLYDAQRIREKRNVTNTVLTQQARAGLFRFYPGVRNGNAESLSPTVDLQGNPVRPAAATGALQSISVFGRDPNRLAPDSTGVVRRMLDLLPLPNNFRSGDGLNTAAYTWSRPSSQDLDQFNIRIDHNFNPLHRLSAAYTHENQTNENLFSVNYFPSAPNGNTAYADRLFNLTLTSTLRPNLLNEFRAGSLRPWLRFYAGWETEAGKSLLPTAANYPYVLVFNTVTDPINQSDNPVGRISPLYQYADNLTWIQGKHSIKGGFDLRFSSSNGFNSADVMPRVSLGTGGAPVVNMDTIPGIGQNLTSAINLLNNLAGSISSVAQALNAPGGNAPYLPGEVKQRTWKRREYGLFLKDDWKVNPHLTLNLGVRWDYYGVPWDQNGRTAGLVGGQASLFGITGSSFADMYQPGRLNGQMTRVELIGPNSANPGRMVHGEDWNNISPHIGFSWALPGLQRRTVLRAGYSIAYERNSLRIVDAVSGDQPGLRERVVFNSGNYLNLPTVRLPLIPNGKPLDVVPLTDRLQTVRAFEDNLRNPYIQNFNASIQREIARDMVLDLRYVGSKGTRLVRGTSINETMIFENGVLDAFRAAASGGESPLLNRIFSGLKVSGCGTVGSGSCTGAGAVRANSTTQAYLAAHNAGTFANYLNESNQFTNVRGGLLRRAGLPENFIYPNPQFASARLTGNFANSTWHSFQAEIIKRFSRGWTLQSNYTWSKSLGEEEGAGEEMIDSYRDLRNWSLDKRLLGFHRTHVFRNSGTAELPFGPNKRFLHSAPAWVSRIVERWQIGAIFNVFSGAPLSITSGRSSWNTFGDNTATAVAAIDKSLGQATRVGNGVVYFQGLTQQPDPSIAALTTLNNIRGRSTLQAIASSSGELLLVNPTPGTLGSLQPGILTGPGEFRLDLNIVKRTRLRENINLELRADIIDATNTPQWDAPNVDMNSVNFGRITSASGNRIVVVGARINF